MASPIGMEQQQLDRRGNPQAPMDDVNDNDVSSSEDEASPSRRNSQLSLDFEANAEDPGQSRRAEVDLFRSAWEAQPDVAADQVMVIVEEEAIGESSQVSVEPDTLVHEPLHQQPENVGDFEEHNSTIHSSNQFTSSTVFENDPSQNLKVLLSDIKRISSGSKIYGREAEIKLLRDRWERCMRNQRQELVVISGPAGTGKSRLAHSLRSLVQQQRDQTTCFAFGKFSESKFHTMAPFEVLSTAIAYYIHQIHDSGDAELVIQCKKAIRCAVYNDRKTLIQMIPAFELLLGSPLSSRSRRRDGGVHHGSFHDSFSSAIYGGESTDRLSGALANAIGALCAHVRLVLLLDDCQWADSASLDLLQNLVRITDKTFSLMVITTARTKGVETSDDEHSSSNSSSQHGGDDERSQILTKTSSKVLEGFLEDVKRGESNSITSIVLDDLSVDDTESLLSDLLSKRPHQVTQLAKMVQAESMGNAFHSFQFLRFLVEQGTVRRNGQDWSWDETSICSTTIPCGTVHDLLSRTVDGLPRPVQEALKIAACLGTEIDVSAIDKVLQTPSAPLLQQAADEGLLHFLPQIGGFRFVHDLILQASFALVPKEERAGFYLNLGRRLWRSSTVAAFEENIMVVVSLMNMGRSSILEERERYKMAELNIRAGQKALKIPSLYDASQFFVEGLKFLDPKSCWDEHRDLSLKLHSHAAEAYAWLGNFEQVEFCLQEIELHCSALDDRLHAYFAMVRAMEQKQRLKEGWTICQRILAKLGEKIPKKASKLHAAKYLFMVKIALQYKTDDEILSMWVMQDNNKRQIMEFLAIGFLHSFHSAPTSAVVVACRSVLLSLKYGMHDFTAIAFVMYAFTLSGLQVDVKHAYRFGKLGMTMALRNPNSQFLTTALNLFGVGINHHTQPIQDSIDILTRSHRLSMEKGMVSVAIAAMQFKHSACIAAGNKHLSTLKADLTKDIELCRFHRNQERKVVLDRFLRVVRCYEGLGSDLHVSYDNVMANDEGIKELSKSGQPIVLVLHCGLAMELAIIHGDFEYAKDMARLCVYHGPKPAYSFDVLPFWICLVGVALWRKGTNRGENIRLARRNHQLIAKSCKYAPCNFRHFQWIMEAELVSTKNRHSFKMVRDLYTNAIRHAHDQQNFKIVALGAELFANYLSSQGMTSDAATQYIFAADSYYEWGSFLKSKEMRDRADKCL